MEHRLPDGGYRQGYFCMRCGESCNMYATGHGPDKCEPNPQLVERLVEANKAERK